MEPVFTDLEGVYASSINCGIKKVKKDLTFIHVPNAVGSAAVFTQNKFEASSVTITRRHSKKYTLKAAIITSGCANCGTGPTGEAHSKSIVQKMASSLGLKVGEVAIAATGGIASILPIEKVLGGMDTLLANPNAKDGLEAAEGILTTDLVAKSAFHSKRIGKKDIVVAGITKGSGMIAPNMATTLTFMVTNASLNNIQLQQYLSKAIDDSFNMSSVDGDTSTNDMVVIFSTGERQFQATNKEESDAFQELMTEACVDLTKQIIRDGEGASKLFTVHVKGAARLKDARKMAYQIINSPLVKTAIHGEDPNWGRILAAAGKDPEVKINPSKVDLYFDDVAMMKNGEIVQEDRDPFRSIMAKSEFSITLDCNLGDAHATAWGCDLGKGYIDINVEYN